MAILGYNVKDTADSQGIGSTGRCYVTKFTLATSATMTELHGWMSGPALASVMRLVIYADSSGLPGAKVAQTNLMSIPGGDIELAQAGFTVSLTAGDYWIGFYAKGGVGATTQAFYSTTSGAVTQGLLSGIADPPPDPFGTPTTNNAKKTCVWAVVSTGSEFLGPLGLIVDSTGALVTVTSGAVALGSVVPGWLTDAGGHLVTASSGQVFPSVIPGISTDASGALATVAAPDGTAFGSVVPGFLTDAVGRFVAASGAPVSMLSGLGRLANGGLATL